MQIVKYQQIIVAKEGENLVTFQEDDWVTIYTIDGKKVDCIIYEIAENVIWVNTGIESYYARNIQFIHKSDIDSIDVFSRKEIR